MKHPSSKIHPPSSIIYPSSSIIHPPSSILRIGLDAKRAFNNGTGLGNYARFVINGMIKQFPQHRYFLFTPSVSPEYMNFYSPSENIKLITPESLLGKTFSSLWRTYAIADMCNELNLDVFHGLSNELPVGIDTFKGKKVVTVHDLIFLRYPNYYKNIDRYIYTKKFRYACEQADIIVATSEQTKKDIIEHFGTVDSKIVVGYQNCDERFGIKSDNEKRILVKDTYHLPEQFILCVGTIEQRKNQLTVLKAFHQLNQPHCKLVFIGKQTDYANQLLQYIQQHNLQDNIIFLQNIPAQQLPAIYQLAAAFVYASEFEGFGIPILEGLRSGIPVIAANASSLPEVGGNHALYFEPANVLGLTAIFKNVLTQPAEIAGLENYLEKFNPTKLISDLESNYHS